MAKFKFKGETIEDIEDEIERLCTLNSTEIPLNHIIKVAKALGVEHITGQNTGSMVRFCHPDVETCGHYFGVHKIHKGGEDAVLKVNFKKYMAPRLREIILKKKEQIAR